MTIKPLIVFAISLLFFSNINAHTTQDFPKVYSIDAAALAANKLKIKANDPALMPAYNKLLKDAEKELAFQPVTVMEKAKFPPSGDKHDYMSIARLFLARLFKTCGGTVYKQGWPGKPRSATV